MRVFLKKFAFLRFIKKTLGIAHEHFHIWSIAFGFDFSKLETAIRWFPQTHKEYIALKLQNSLNNEKWIIKFSLPYFNDRVTQCGDGSSEYFLQDLFIARRIFDNKPEKHVDIGSRIDGFIAHVAVFRKIEVLDIRPLTTEDPNILFKQCDITNIDKDYRCYCDSLSCLHTLEHFGLGRYGDRIDIDGYILGFRSLYQILKPRGTLYLSVPIGKQRIEFNAHRVFSVNTILDMAEGLFYLTNFSYINQGHLYSMNDLILLRNIGETISGCGLFEFRKMDSESTLIK